ncbi:MAG: DUF4124 domain-containing protein [Pseudomonadales bacterium]|uniref:DUF4124 domain-containing protein n=1 Tax=Marinobacter xestospongiae TaxID=994319 RepID=UPI002002CF8B|nr:DUF4124 domain-containing protein [Marinobacter xestospongiae]MCG8517375.1 DUF4124 domain-containing protein [Pseudomonadales bacterium]MCK7568667.1 DUF4124 domain-containing protein [Marinobacter xestospongiae]
MPLTSYKPLAVGLLAMTLSGLSQAAIYRCSQNGHTVFADRPCGDNTETVAVDPVTTGGRLDTGTDVEFYQPPETSRRQQAPGCPVGYLQSTELRRLRVQSRVRAGMSEDQVRYILGDPAQRAGQWWVYRRKGEETGRYRFRNGCLDKWR